jgi:hypothetical protein
MTTPRDPDRLIHAFLVDGAEQLQDQVYDVVRAEIEHKRQRVVLGPWRVPAMSKLIPIGLGAAAVIAVLFFGSQFIGSPSSNVGGAPSAEPTTSPSPAPIGGTVQYQMDGGPATTEVTAIGDGESVSGTAITTFVKGTHTVRLECAARDGNRWAFVGTTEHTTLPGERAGDWSAVVVEDGTPKKIGIVLSIEKSAGEDCAAEWGSASFADMDISSPVESGELVPPPDLAP